MRRYQVVGGIFGWSLPVSAGVLLALCAFATEWTAMAFVATVALMASSVQRGLAVEVTPRGLSRQLRIGRAAVGASPVVAWSAADEIVTRWRRPNDYSMLETIVRGNGVSVRFTTRMGYRAYHALVSEIVRCAPSARRTGLTEQVLREPPG